MRRRRRKKPRAQLDTIDSINITPLLDLVFLLLIVFMLSMPLLETGLGVNTPKLNARELPQEKVRHLSLLADGGLEFDRKPVSLTELTALLQQLKSSQPDAVVLLRGDGARPYEDVVNLLREVRNSGFGNITLVTSPETPKR